MNSSLSKDLVTTDNEIIILKTEINNHKDFDGLGLGFHNESDNSTIYTTLSPEQLINKKEYSVNKLSTENKELYG